MFNDNRTQVKRLHVSRPDSFATFVASYIPKNWRLREELHAEDFADYPAARRVELVEATLRRLERRKRLTKTKELVPVLLGRGTSSKRVEQRLMVCYWPTTVLDEIAKC
jgi:hypothetical protein